MELRLRKFGRGYWLYVPASLIKILGEPESFIVEKIESNGELLLKVKR